MEVWKQGFNHWHDLIPQYDRTYLSGLEGTWVPGYMTSPGTEWESSMSLRFSKVKLLTKFSWMH